MPEIAAPNIDDLLALRDLWCEPWQAYRPEGQVQPGPRPAGPPPWRVAQVAEACVGALPGDAHVLFYGPDTHGLPFDQGLAYTRRFVADAAAVFDRAAIAAALDGAFALYPWGAHPLCALAPLPVWGGVGGRAVAVSGRGAAERLHRLGLDALSPEFRRVYAVAMGPIPADLLRRVAKCGNTIESERRARRRADALRALAQSAKGAAEAAASAALEAGEVAWMTAAAADAERLAVEADQAREGQKRAAKAAAAFQRGLADALPTTDLSISIRG